MMMINIAYSLNLNDGDRINVYLIALLHAVVLEC